MKVYHFMNVLIRPAAKADYQDIWRINLTAFGYEFPLERTRERLADILTRSNNRITVAEADGRVVGYIHCADYDCTYSEPLKNILAIAVEEDLRDLGVGRQLHRAAEDWAREDGCAGMRLVSGFDREGAHGFYLACGYTLRKNQKNFVKAFQDDVKK